VPDKARQQAKKTAKASRTPAKAGAARAAAAKPSAAKRPAVKSAPAKAAAAKPSAVQRQAAKQPAPATKSAATKSAVARSAAVKSAAKNGVKSDAVRANAAKAPAPVKASSPPKAPKPAVAERPAVATAPQAPVAERKKIPPSARATADRAPAAKPPVRSKPESEGAAPGMTTNKTTQRQGFKTGEFIVYPAHGVGQIVSIEEQEIAGAKLELFVINFIKDKMTLRVPTAKIVSVGMRKLAEAPTIKKALETLKGRARVKRTMWSRRAQEYEAKINSGDIVAIAEVVRDLFRSESQPEQSYSERQLYEAALDRLSREIAAVNRITETEAVKEIEGALAKGPRRGPKAEADAEAADADDAVEDEAA